MVGAQKARTNNRRTERLEKQQLLRSL